MDTIKQLREYVRESIKTHPELKSEILDLYQLCLDEVEEGASESNEVYLCVSSIEQLIEEN